MVGERLREVRLAQRLSLSDVAAKAGISAATLSRIETNKQSVDVSMFIVIARILKTAPRDFLAEDGDEQPAPLARRISMLAVSQRTKLWRDLASARRRGRRADMRSIHQQVEELLAQIDLLRQEIEVVRTQVKRTR